MGTAGTTKGIRQLLVIAGALVALAAASASPAHAGDESLLGCGYEPVHPFLQWLDPLPYTLLPGGDFESGAAGWKLSGGARVVDGNEPFYVTQARGLPLAAAAPGQLGDEPDDVHGPRAAGRPLLLERRQGALATCASRRSTPTPPGVQRSLDLLPGGLPDPFVGAEPAGAPAARRCSTR